MTNFVVVFLETIYATVVDLFRRDGITRGGSSTVELWVVTTTLLLLGKFAAGSIGPRLFSRRSMSPVVQLMKILNTGALNYTLGLMEPSSSSSSSCGGGGGVGDGHRTMDSFFQVWAVLLVAMNYSVSLGRPYRGSKDLTLVDLLSSLWSASLLRRSNTPLRLRLPLWLIWSLNAWRIIRYYIDAKRAAEASEANMKLVGDYMASAASDDVAACSPATMSGYRYLVLGEERQDMKIVLQRPLESSTTRRRRRSFTVQLNETRPEELVTLEKVWRLRESGDGLLGRDADGDNRFKDVCLSFALYKLLRRRFYDFPMPEAHDPAAIRRLVCEAILEDANGYERAFRVTEVELSLLHDFSYTKHAVVFSAGFPIQRLLLSLIMAAAVSYLAYAVRDIPSSTDKARPHLARISHGVSITRCIIAVIVSREVWEMVIYVFSQWTKVLIICHYVKLPRQQRMRRWLTEKVARIMFKGIRRGHWDQEIRQYNLLLATAAGNHRACGLLPRRTAVKLDAEVKKALFVSLKALDPQHGRPLGSYFERAFPGGDSRIDHLLGELKGETHKVLVWHVATCLCQIDLLEKARQPARLYREPGSPFVGGSGQTQAPAPPQYTVAVSLSNYCAYLITQGLVPDNGLVARKVFKAVRGEARDALRRCSAKKEIYDALVVPARQTVEHRSPAVSIVEIGAELSVMLASMYNKSNGGGEDDELWDRLGRFWAGYLLQLSAWTRAAKHQIHLRGHGELTTHLWALLSHAGFLGPLHGHQLLDQVDQS